MTINITDVDTFTDPVQAPDDGDPASGAIFQLAPQALANRTRHLKNRADALLVKCVSSAAHGYTGSSGWSLGAFWATQTTGAQEMRVNITDALVHGRTLSDVGIRVDPGAARGAGNRMKFKLYRKPFASTEATIGTETQDDGTSSEQTVSIAGVAGHVIDVQNYTYSVGVRSGSDADTNIDVLHDLKVTMT